MRQVIRRCKHYTNKLLVVSTKTSLISCWPLISFFLLFSAFSLLKTSSLHCYRLRNRILHAHMSLHGALRGMMLAKLHNCRQLSLRLRKIVLFESAVKSKPNFVRRIGKIMHSMILLCWDTAYVWLLE